MEARSVPLFVHAIEVLYAEAGVAMACFENLGCQLASKYVVLVCSLDSVRPVEGGRVCLCCK